jgi:hypothetical protein
MQEISTGLSIPTSKTTLFLAARAIFAVQSGVWPRYEGIWATAGSSSQPALGLVNAR